MPDGWEVFYPLLHHLDYGRDQSTVLFEQSKAVIDDPDPRPFFLYLTPAAPHGPNYGPLECDAVPTPPFPEPPSFDPKFEGSRLQTYRWPQRLSSLCGIDILVRRVVSELEATGQLENTIIVLTSDQGFQLGEHGLVSKGVLFEETIHVPLIIAGPGFPAGEERGRLVSLIDLAPTLAEIAGAPVPPVEGRSFLTGERRSFVAIQTDVCRGKRRANEKLMMCGGVTSWVDLERDPFEMRPTVLP